MTDDFFRNRLDLMIDLRHPLAVPAPHLPILSGTEYFEHHWP
jgi:hypothetical protein